MEPSESVAGVTAAIETGFESLHAASSKLITDQRSLMLQTVRELLKSTTENTEKAHKKEIDDVHGRVEELQKQLKVAMTYRKKCQSMEEKHAKLREEAAASEALLSRLHELVSDGGDADNNLNADLCWEDKLICTYKEGQNAQKQLEEEVKKLRRHKELLKAEYKKERKLRKQFQSQCNAVRPSTEMPGNDALPSAHLGSSGKPKRADDTPGVRLSNQVGQEDPIDLERSDAYNNAEAAQCAKQEDQKWRLKEAEEGNLRIDPGGLAERDTHTRPEQGNSSQHKLNIPLHQSATKSLSRPPSLMVKTTSQGEKAQDGGGSPCIEVTSTSSRPKTKHAKARSSADSRKEFALEGGQPALLKPKARKPYRNLDFHNDGGKWRDRNEGNVSAVLRKDRGHKRKSPDSTSADDSPAWQKDTKVGRMQKSQAGAGSQDAGIPAGYLPTQEGLLPEPSPGAMSRCSPAGLRAGVASSVGQAGVRATPQKIARGDFGPASPPRRVAEVDVLHQEEDATSLGGFPGAQQRNLQAVAVPEKPLVGNLPGPSKPSSTTGARLTGVNATLHLLDDYQRVSNGYAMGPPKPVRDRMPAIVEKLPAPARRKSRPVSPAAANNQEPTYKYREVVRKKADRENLTGFECPDCAGFYKACASWGLPDPNMKFEGCGHKDKQQQTAAAIDKLRQEGSRHRFKHKPPSTPPGFWNLGFPDSLDPPE